jgi:hypothetical protein
MDDLFSHYVYEDQFIGESGIKTLYLHIVSQGIMCLISLIINMCMTDTWSWFDELKGKNVMGRLDTYGSEVSDMLWAWIPCSFAFVFAGIGESFLAFQRVH